MDTLSTYPLIIVLITMLLSAFFAGMEIAFVSANKVRLEIDIQKGGLVNRIIHSFYSHSDVFISTMLVGNNVVNVVYSMAMASLISEPINAWLGGNEFLQLILITIISTVIILITGEFLPKAIFRINPNASLRMFSLPLFMCYCVLYPLSRFTEMLSQCLMRLIGIKIDKAKMDRLTVEEPVSAKWITTADSIYRAVAYYNKVGDGKAQIVSVGNVPTLVPVDSVENVITDPITFESMWRSRNGAFLNLSIWIKVGNTSVENAHQTIGLLRTEVTKTDDGRTTTHLTLLHSQGDVPEKYSTQYFLSIPRDSIPTDSVHISINTYSGQLEKTIAL